MLYLDYLIKLFYCKHGDFEGIEKCNFYSDIVGCFEKSEFTKLEDYLYSVVGYSYNDKYTVSEIVSERKSFCHNSHKPSYIESLVNKYKVKTRNGLSELLSELGILGIQKRPINTIGDCKNLKVPRSFLNKDNCTLLVLLSNYLDCSGFYRFNVFQLKAMCISNPNVKEVLDSVGLSFADFISVKFNDEIDVPYIKDNVLYCKSTGETEEVTRDYLVSLYLYGMPVIPLYVRSSFVSALPKLIYPILMDSSLLDVLDISYLTGFTVEQLMNVFGYTLPDPEEIFSMCGGFFCLVEDKVYYTKGDFPHLVTIDKKEFLTLLNNESLLSLNLKEYYNIKKLSSLNIFGQE